MNHKWLLPVAIFGCISIASPMLYAQNDNDHHGPQGQANHDHMGGPPNRSDNDAHDSPHAVSLGHEMKSMGHAYKMIRSQVKDPTKNASTLAAVLNMEQHTLAAKSATPPVLGNDHPTAAEVAKTKAAFEVEMITLVRRELDLEVALLANDQSQAIKDAAALHSVQEQGHREFKPKDEQ